MNFHEVANIFPLMGEAELNDLADDIATNGLQEPIWTWQEAIIDGCNRFRARITPITLGARQQVDGLTE